MSKLKRVAKIMLRCSCNLGTFIKTSLDNAQDPYLGLLHGRKGLGIFVVLLFELRIFSLLS